MPYVFIRDYDLELVELNKDMYHVYVESHGGVGGERKTWDIRWAVEVRRHVDQWQHHFSHEPLKTTIELFSGSSFPL